jgi:two-component system response regulator AtoC
MAEKEKILVVDDEPGVRELLKSMLGRKGYRVTAASGGEQALALLKEQDFDLVITDLRMPGLPGEELVARVKKAQPALPVVVISAHGGTKSVVEVVKHGAEDYLAKPFEAADLELTVFKALAKRRLLMENQRLRRELAGGGEGFEGMVGHSAAMRKVFDLLPRLAASDAPVLILGESGTGKELAARALHRRSPRAAQPFVAVNAGALPESLVEAELFGAKRGAYTSLNEDREGLFQAADKGTLFLDELGELPLGAQAKLLRVLESGEVKAVGDTRMRKVDVRVIAATHRDLGRMVKQGQFRQDLYFRLAVLPLPLPPLRERLDDLPLLGEALLKKRGGHKRLGPAALKALRLRAWDGNVRELNNVLERACLLAPGDEIQPEDLWLADESGREQGSLPSGPFKQAKRQAVEAFERHYLEQALRAQHGNVSKAAAACGLARRNLQVMLKKHGLKPGQYKGPAA